MAQKMKLSIALAVYNEEKNLASCLESVRDIADEIVIVDGNSTDKTLEIAQHFRAKIIHEENRKMFHINKQIALNACTNDWILQLDADEVVPANLSKEIQHIIGSTPKEHGFFIARKNYFWGHFMNKGGQYPDFVLRLVRKGYAKFPCESVHEQILVSGDVGYLEHPMLHYSYRSRADYWKKADAYTSLTADTMKKNGIQPSISMWIKYSFLLPAKTFFSIFIRHKGFMDGITGLEFSYYSAMHHAIAYRKFTSRVRGL